MCTTLSPGSLALGTLEKAESRAAHHCHHEKSGRWREGVQPEALIANLHSLLCCEGDPNCPRRDAPVHVADPEPVCDRVHREVAVGNVRRLAAPRHVEERLSHNQTPVWGDLHDLVDPALLHRVKVAVSNPLPGRHLEGLYHWPAPANPYLEDRYRPQCPGQERHDSGSDENDQRQPERKQLLQWTSGELAGGGALRASACQPHYYLMTPISL